MLQHKNNDTNSATETRPKLSNFYTHFNLFKATGVVGGHPSCQSGERQTGGQSVQGIIQKKSEKQPCAHTHIYSQFRVRVCGKACTDTGKLQTRNHLTVLPVRTTIALCSKDPDNNKRNYFSENSVQFFRVELVTAHIRIVVRLLFYFSHGTHKALVLLYHHAHKAQRFSSALVIAVAERAVESFTFWKWELGVWGRTFFFLLFHKLHPVHGSTFLL